MIKMNACISLVFASSNIGGAEIASSMLVKLNPYQHIDIFCPRGSESSYRELFSSSNSVIRIFSLPSAEGVSNKLHKLHLILKRRNIILKQLSHDGHVVLVGVDASALNIIPGESRFIPYLHEFLDTLSWQRKLLTYISVINARSILAPVRRISNNRHLLFSSKLFAVSNFKKNQFLSSEVKLKNLKDTDKLRVGMVGRVEHNKNQLFSIYLCSYLKFLGFNADLSLAGSVQNERYFEEILVKAKDLGVNITQQQYTHEAMSEFYNACDILIISSHTELIPNTIFEALMYGVPVFSTNVGAVCDCLPNEFVFDIKNGVERAGKLIIDFLRQPSDTKEKLFDECVRTAANELDTFSLMDAITLAAKDNHGDRD